MKFSSSLQMFGYAEFITISQKPLQLFSKECLQWLLDLVDQLVGKVCLEQNLIL
jgi:hypothetical protein